MVGLVPTIAACDADDGPDDDSRSGQSFCPDAGLTRAKTWMVAASGGHDDLLHFSPLSARATEGFP